RWSTRSAAAIARPTTTPARPTAPARAFSPPGPAEGRPGRLRVVDWRLPPHRSPSHGLRSPQVPPLPAGPPARAPLAGPGPVPGAELVRGGPARRQPGAGQADERLAEEADVPA